MRKRGLKVQTLLFDRKKFNEPKAAVWALVHGFKFRKIDEKPNTLRLRQIHPKMFAKKSFRTIVFKPGIKAVVGRPK